MVIFVSLIYLGIIGLEVPYLLKKKMWRELAVFGFILLLAMIYSFGLLLDRQLPNLVKGMELLFGPLTRIMENVLG